MTAQINDLFQYDGVEYAVTGISEGALFDPEILNLKPSVASTACWRGYQAVYAMSDSHLVLDKLHVNLTTTVGSGYQKRIQGPVLNGISPITSHERDDFFNNHYEGLKFHLDYSGGLLLANEFISELYVHMGFHPAWKYKKVIELIFENGVLQNHFDRSEKMARVRQKLVESRENQESVTKPSSEQIQMFIEHAFDRTYTM
jgi:hypothetical protein